MTDYFRGKAVLITGASSGLGLSLLRLLERGTADTIIASSRSVSNLQKIVNDLGLDPNRVKFLALDLESSDSEIYNAVEKASEFVPNGIDIVINCAGMGFRGRIDETRGDVDRRIMQVDYFGQVAVIKSVMRCWSISGKPNGHIVQVSSVQGYFGLGERAPYAAAKHALVGFIDSLRVELSSYPYGDDFRVTLVSPGYIATSHSSNALTGDGTIYAKEDESTATGYSPDYVASLVLKHSALGTPEVVIADFKIRLLIVLRSLFAGLCFRLLRNRYKGKKEAFLVSFVKWLVGLD